MLALSLLFDAPPDLDFAGYEALALGCWMEPGVCPDGAPGCPERRCRPLSLAIVPRGGRDDELWVERPPPGAVAMFCVAAVDRAGNRSPCVGGPE